MDEALTPAEYKAVRDRAPEFLGDLMDHVAEVLAEAGIDADKAALFGLATALRLRQRWAKQVIYFAEGRGIDLRARNRRIWEEFNGHNHDELAVKFGVSRVWIYRIIALMQAELRAERQGRLDLQ